MTINNQQRVVMITGLTRNRRILIAKRKKRATEALWYNGLVQSWPEISRLARETPPPGFAEEAQASFELL